MAIVQLFFLPSTVQPFRQKSEGTNVDSAQLIGVLGIGLGLKLNLLALGEVLEALDLDGREVNENVVAAVVVGNKAIALTGVEPFNSSAVHV